jgi:hypothetical protein
VGRAEPRASDYAREALSEWGDAVRYAVAAIAPAAKHATEAAKEAAIHAAGSTKQAVVDRAADGGGESLRDRLNPSKTDKGGRIGHAADEVLERLGGPGKLAAKASLGSRVVDRLLPDGTGNGGEPDAEEREAAEPASDGDTEPASDGPDASDADETAAAADDQASPEGSSDPEDAEFEFERDYAARHDRLPPNAYPEITH